MLLGGEPGIGKSTLMLQVALMAGRDDLKVLYVSGEESPDQVKMRANRLGTISDHVLIYPETQVQGVLEAMTKERPSLVVIDSIQTMDMAGLDGVPGSVSQIRESAAALTANAKSMGIPLFMVGHITKEGSLAGQKSWSTWSTSCCNSKETGTMRIGCYVRRRIGLERHRNWASMKCMAMDCEASTTRVKCCWVIGQKRKVARLWRCLCKG